MVADCSDWTDKDGDDQAKKCTVLNEGEANKKNEAFINVGMTKG